MFGSRVCDWLQPVQHYYARYYDAARDERTGH